MSRTKEEVAAELVWRYVEYLREETGSGRAASFSRDELEQLVQALETASRVPEALEGEPSAAAVSAARAHLDATLAAAPPSAPPSAPHAPAPRPALPLPRRLRDWTLPAAVAAVLILSLALATVPMWHHVPT